ncbi:MAG: response regulator [Sulfuricurvum sp.]|nr:response regulator [Sulfuricurvum sp.]
MTDLKLLIVDDMDVNRFILANICGKLNNIETREAENGIEAIEIAEQWHPDIILMDIVMPKMDGYEASKVIRARYPEIMIIAISAMADPSMEKNLASIGVVTYIHEPMDKDFIQFKLESFCELIRAQKGKFKQLSNAKALNPFSTDIRHLKTVFNIDDAESMMDFGMWILGKVPLSCFKVDIALELFYSIMRQNTFNQKTLSIIVEENFYEIFVTIESAEGFVLQQASRALADKLKDKCVITDTCIYVRMPLQESAPLSTTPVKLPEKHMEVLIPIVETKIESVELICTPEKSLETRVVVGEEKDLLRQSFTQKTSAQEYVQDIGGDVLDEIRDLSSADNEWQEDLSALDNEATVENLHHFAESVLGTYIHAINGLFEFTALGYALSALALSIKENSEGIIGDPKRLKTLLMLLEHLGEDLSSWREHIFIAQDTADIHYLDSSFFSSCMQIEGIVSNKVVQSDDNDEMEFF